MSLRIHHVASQQSAGVLTSHGHSYPYGVTTCGRTAPNWARRTTHNMDLVDCEVCLTKLVEQRLLALNHLGMST